MLKALFKPSPVTIAGRALYGACTAAARRPTFYLPAPQGAGAPDTPEGRFELYLIHVVLVVRRLKGEGPGAKVVSQALFDAFLRGLDDGLREMGVGDLSVGKKMRKLGEAIYGRLKAYEETLAEDDRVPAVQALVARTLYADLPDATDQKAGAEEVAAYVIAAAEHLSRQPLEALLQGHVSFPAARAEEQAA